jgi:hypothetical protein
MPLLSFPDPFRVTRYHPEPHGVAASQNVLICAKGSPARLPREFLVLPMSLRRKFEK